MHFYEALEKVNPEPSKPDPEPAAGITADDLKNIMNSLKESIQLDREAIKKELLDELKQASNVSSDTNDNNNPEKEDNK